MVVVTKVTLKGPERLNLSSEITSLEEARKLIENLLRVLKEFNVVVETTDIEIGES
jgi:hypothetical protein